MKRLMNRLSPEVALEGLFIAVVLNAGGLAVLVFFVGPSRAMSSPLWITSFGLWLGLTGYGFMHLRRKRSAQAAHQHSLSAHLVLRSQYHLAAAYVCVAGSLFALALACLVLFSGLSGRP